jgi:hypothetical protein
VFHLELRQFPHVARAFNLTREELDSRFAEPWVSGGSVEHEDRRWSPERARLTIYEGPALRPDEIGMGRGWATVGKTSRDVTETVLAQAQRGAQDRSTVEAFKERICGAVATAITFGEVVQLASAEHPLWRASELLALAEQAVWELLHQGRLTLDDPEGAVPAERWQAAVISWSTWVGSGPGELTLRAAGGS